MADDSSELARHLFAAATAMLEDAVGLAVTGQSPRRSPAQRAAAGRRLQVLLHDAAVVAEAAAILAQPAGKRPSRGRQNRS